MKMVSGMVVGMLLVGLLAISGAMATEDLDTSTIEETSLKTSGDPISPEEVEYEIYSRLPAGTSETIKAMGEEHCKTGLRVLNDQGWYVPPNRDAYGFEYDILSGACKDFRDTLEHRVLNGQDPPFLMACQDFYGVNCLAVGHYACDFALIVGSGLVYYCLGGITPYN